MAAQFDGDALVMTLDVPTGGILNQATEQAYDDAKQWHLNANNRKYPFPFTTSGGEDITAVEQAGQYYFLRNDLGWRIISTDESQNVFWDGNLIPFDLTLPIIIETPGRTVLHLGLQPLTTVIATGSGVTQQDKDDIENQIFARIVEDGHSFEELVRIIVADAAGKIIEDVLGNYSIRDLADLKARITGSDEDNGGRSISSVDGS